MASTRPPTTTVGSSPPAANTAATIEVVVVLPCMPAMAMPYFSLINSASISARWITGMCSLCASVTSALSAAMAEHDEYRGMATTASAVLLSKDGASVAHVGDSRVYLWRAGVLQQLTNDHSWVGEQVRAGVQSLPRGQWYAAMAIGLTQPQVYRYILMPMAFRIIIPPLTSETMNLIKNSSIALTIGLAELTFRSREMGEYTFHFFEAFTAATVIYIAIAMTANRVMALVERRVAVPGYIAGGK